jgi:hypothetical protein
VKFILVGDTDGKENLLGKAEKWELENILNLLDI